MDTIISLGLVNREERLRLTSNLTQSASLELPPRVQTKELYFFKNLRALTFGFLTPSPIFEAGQD